VFFFFFLKFKNQKVYFEKEIKSRRERQIDFKHKVPKTGTFRLFDPILDSEL